LSHDTAQLTLEGVRAAKRCGVTVSFDFNYRPSLWKNLGDPQAAERFFEELMPYVDVVFGGRNDFVQRLKVPAFAESSLGDVLESTARAYPHCKAIACTTRRVLSACRNDWGGVCYADGRLYRSKDYPGLEILDRIGGGDGFAAGLLYGMLTGLPMQQALEYGVAHGALAMTTPGDTSMASLDDVRKLAGGGLAEVLR
ncbi:MAG: PfkB family carbohydrate kinase, partial [Eubacteriales bacterium]|nr:PfkB family carbohydrate kinase [Eubacteriales bacterium]